MLQKIEANFEVDINDSKPINTGRVVSSADRHFMIEVTVDKVLEEMVVLIKGSGVYYEKEATLANPETNLWQVVFDTRFISRYDIFKTYFYGRSAIGTVDERAYDVGALSFEAKLSELDRALYKVKPYYFEPLEELIQQATTQVAIMDANETNRASTFSTNEVDRASTFTEGEAKRVSAFNLAENARGVNEVTRQENESLRVSAEETRSVSEGIRNTNENLRVGAESSRVTAEQLRVSQNAERQFLRDLDTGKNYHAILEIYQGKPRLKLEEIITL